MFTFSDEYLLKTMMSLVRDESNRIVSLGLATQKAIQGFIDPELEFVVRKVPRIAEKKSVVLDKLTEIHNKLAMVRLPGDFEKLSATDDRQILDMIGVDVLADEPETPDVVCAPEEKQETEDGGNEQVAAVYSFLDDLAYELGRNGNHRAAYMVERTMQKIGELVKK